MSYKMIFIDVDGTLLNTNDTISQENKEAIRYAHDKGVKIVLCSGRSYVNLISFAKEVDIYDENIFIVSFNGGMIIQGNQEKIFQQHMLTKQKALAVVKELRKFGVDIIIYDSPWSSLTESDSEATRKYYAVTTLEHTKVECLEDHLPSDIAKILVVTVLGDTEVLAKIEQYMRERLDPDINMFYSASFMLEFTQEKATKGSAVEYLANHLNIPLSEVIAIGDSQNDLSMIKKAGMGVAVANAREEVRQKADYVTRNTNDNAAVAETIYQFI